MVSGVFHKCAIATRNTHGVDTVNHVVGESLQAEPSILDTVAVDLRHGHDDSLVEVAIEDTHGKHRQKRPEDVPEQDELKKAGESRPISFVLVGERSADHSRCTRRQSWSRRRSRTGRRTGCRYQ